MSEKRAAWWEKQRAKGKWFYILQEWFFFFIGMTISRHLFSWYFDDKLELDYFSTIWFLAFGFVIGLVNWFWNDGKYQEYILDKKIKSGLKL